MRERAGVLYLICSFWVNDVCKKLIRAKNDDSKDGESSIAMGTAVTSVSERKRQKQGRYRVSKRDGIGE